ncbi:MAG: single-stranded DNA-binding protein [Clostridia bacterium]|nr:single-stranded DNA-binding protein [Clostridia bacterium]
MNKTIITGNLTKDPELMETSSGVAYANFTVAVNGITNDTDGNRPTYFYSCTAWRGRAENIAKYCKKGSKVLVEGEMQSRKYTDKDGNERTAWNLVANKVEFLSGGARQDDEEEPRVTRQQRPQPTLIDDNQLPF